MPKEIAYTEVQCFFCRELIIMNARSTYRRGSGWFHAKPSAKGINSISSAALVQWKEQYSCKECIYKQTHGMSVGQLAMFPYDDADD